MVVGASGETLSVTVTPDTLLRASGEVTVSFPDYYTSAGTDQFVEPTGLSCEGEPGVLSSVSCAFEPERRTLTLSYSLASGEDRTAATTFLVGNFKNPVSTRPTTGFSLATFDSAARKIAQSGDLTLAGITQPAGFRFVSFGFADTSRVNEYSTFSVNIGMEVPLEKTCYIKIVFPDEFVFDSNLFLLSGTSFLIPSGNTDQPWISMDYDARTVVIKGCEYNYGASNSGTLTFIKVLNPEYVKDTETFKIYVYQDSNNEYLIAE